MVDISGPMLWGNPVPRPPPMPIPDPDAKPVDLWGKFDPPPLPNGLLPTVVENFARVIGEHMGADPAGLAMAALTVLGAAIPDTVRIRVKQHDAGWIEAPRLWIVLVGPPSTKKSPIITAAVAPLARIDTQLARDWQATTARWNALDKEARKTVPEPPQKRLRIEDTTVEAAQEVLKGSPGGVLCVQDELSGWFAAMERYHGGKGAGADRAFWLQAFNGGEYVVNRIGRGVTIIPNLSISLLGGIQPEPIRKIAADATDDGLLQRMFPVILQPATVGHDRPLPPAQALYDFAVSAAYHATPPAGGRLVFDARAQAIRSWLENKHQRLVAGELVTRKLAAHIGKLDGLFARLCVIWHVVEGGYSPLLPAVSEGVAWRVATFMETFLLPHAASFYAGVLGLGDDHERLQAIAGYILAHRLFSLTARDVQRGDTAMRKIARAPASNGAIAGAELAFAIVRPAPVLRYGVDSQSRCASAVYRACGTRAASQKRDQGRACGAICAAMNFVRFVPCARGKHGRIKFVECPHLLKKKEMRAASIRTRGKPDKNSCSEPTNAIKRPSSAI